VVIRPRREGTRGMSGRLATADGRIVTGFGSKFSPRFKNVWKKFRSGSPAMVAHYGLVGCPIPVDA
jgi:hypothetical protein